MEQVLPALAPRQIEQRRQTECYDPARALEVATAERDGVDELGDFGAWGCEGDERHYPDGHA